MVQRTAVWYFFWGGVADRDLAETQFYNEHIKARHVTMYEFAFIVIVGNDFQHRFRRRYPTTIPGKKKCFATTRLRPKFRNTTFHVSKTFNHGKNEPSLTCRSRT